jgi:hypothetical protein
MTTTSGPLISLNDDQLTAVMQTAAPIHPRFRGEFLEEVAKELARLPEIGDGAVHRVLAMVQRRFFDPPREGAPRHLGSKRPG